MPRASNAFEDYTSLQSHYVKAYNSVNLNLNSRLWRLSKVRTGSPYR